MTKDDMTAPIPRTELVPIIQDALEYDPAHSFTVKEIHRMVDTTLRKDHPEYHVHEQTVRQLLKEWDTVAHGHVYMRQAEIGEHPNSTNAGNRIGLYSLTTPVPVWSGELGAQIVSAFPSPRPVPISTRGRRRTSEVVEDAITRAAKEPQGSETPNARAELICTLVRELVADSVSTDRLQARDEEITRLKAELATVSREAKSLRAQLKKIRNLLGNGV
jgi:hypothetical protein